MTRTNRGVAAWVTVVGTVAVVAAHFVSDTSGAHLELAPVFVGAAVAAAGVHMFRSRPRRDRG